MTAQHAVSAPGDWHSQTQRTLEHAAMRWDQRRPTDDATLDPYVWLRAGRSAWLLGDLPAAQLWYGRAADDVLDVALGFGSVSGTFAYYAEPALAAAVLSSSVLEKGGVLARIADVIRAQPVTLVSQSSGAGGATAGARRTRVARGGGTGRGPSGRSAAASAAAHETLRAWAYWCAGDTRACTLAGLAAARHATGLPAMAEQRWRRSHWPDLLEAVQALADASAAPLLRALRALDLKLGALELGPGPVNEPRTHETLAALAFEWRRRYPRTYNAEGFLLTIEPGQLDGAVQAPAPVAGA